MAQKSYAQNLIPNYSFEVYDTCPSNFNGGLVRFALPWKNPTAASPDYFNACDASGAYGVPLNISGGYQNAKDGNAYIGIVMYQDLNTDAREYVQVKLIDTLSADSCYKLTFYVSIGNLFDCYKITNFDAYFSSSLITATNTTVFPYTPQITYLNTAGIGDTASWYKVEGVFQSQGDEQYMTIGNFHNDASTTRIIYDAGCLYSGYAYYFIDSVSLTKVTCPIDIGIIDNSKPNFSFNLFPNPNDGNMVLNYSIRLGDKAVMIIYDVTGKLISNYILNSSLTQIQIHPDLFNNGIYFYQIMVNDRAVQADKLVIIK